MPPQSTRAEAVGARRYGLTMRTKLVLIFLAAKVLPLLFLAYIAWYQFALLGDVLRTTAVEDARKALNDSAVKNIERMSTDTARRVAEFLYARDDDLRYLAKLPPTRENYARFLSARRGRLIRAGKWELAADGKSWIDTTPRRATAKAVSENKENEDGGAFHSTEDEIFEYDHVPLFDEASFVSPDGMELFKIVSPDTTKRRHRPHPEPRDVSRRENTFVKAETWFAEAKKLAPGEIFVSDVIGAYTPANYIGMYTPQNVAKAADDRKYPIEYAPEKQAYAGRENPNGVRFEGIVRWATPVAGPDGAVAGYVTFALNHDHIMEFVDHITPFDERYVKLPSGAEGNYAFIWDYNCRSICHPRHHSITGFNPETGEPEIPMLETSIYNGWQKSGIRHWLDYVRQHGPEPFFEQSRTKKPHPDLVRRGLVGLDGRYLNNAPQCIGWMNLTGGGGSGSFYIFWSGLYKLNTAAAIPYYTGHYAPSAENNFSRRGFGFVAIGSSVEYFTAPAKSMEEKLDGSIGAMMSVTLNRLVGTTALLTAIVIAIALWMAWNISRPITDMARVMSRLATGDTVDDDEVPLRDRRRYDEIGTLGRSLHELAQARSDELDMASGIANGDYTRGVRLRSDRDRLGQAFNAMIRMNKDALLRVNSTVDEVGGDADDVSAVSASLARGVETSEGVLREIAGAVGVVEQQARENSENARNANELADHSRHAAQRGYHSVVELTAAMGQIRQAGQKIASVSKLIDDIAFQTNLLSLNAAVEAARAGKNGKGFAVVAQEVRNLSSRSARAAHESGEMVAEMIKLMETGAELAEHSDQEFRDIVDTTVRVAQLFNNIVDASNEQTAAMSQVVGSLGRIDQVTRENSSNAKRMADSANTLSARADELRHLISRFRLNDAEDRPRLPGPDPRDI